MRIKQYLILIVTVLFFASCGGPKVLVNHKSTAEEAVLAGNYEKAVTAWKSYFNQQFDSGNEVEGAVYAQAAKAAYNAEMYSQATDWFDQARQKDYADAEMYKMMAQIYRGMNNISKELEALEFYVENFESDNTAVNKRLFQIYYEIDMKDKALATLERIPNDSIKSEKMIEKVFLLNKKAENDEVTDSISQVLLEMDPDNVPALEWNALKYYWEAENHYRREMKKYEQNKTGLQYVFLRKELKQVTSNFKKSLNYFEKLWKIDPGKKYAPYMANIHTRFDEPEKSAYYRKFLDE